MQSIEPFGPRLLVRLKDTEKISPGGIHIPDAAQKKSCEAEVLALGIGGKNEDGTDFEFTAAVGDRILISRYGGTEVDFEDGREGDFQIITEVEILGRLKGE